jgi:hypothetical protein
MEEYLKPCPFCPHGYGFFRNESGRYNGVVWVECDWPSNAVRLTAAKDAAPPCGAKTAEYQTEEEAAKAWNTRADLPRATAADIERERIIAMADALEYELPNLEQMKGVETLRKKLQAEPSRATGETTVESALSELRKMFPSNFIRVRTVIERAFDEKAGEEFDREHRAWILVMNRGEFHGSTLADCMAQVRATRREGEGEKADG